MSLRSEEHTSELQSPCNLVCRLLLEKKKQNKKTHQFIRRSAPSMLRCSSLRTLAERKRAGRVIGCVIFTYAAVCLSVFFFFNDTATTEIYTLSLHDALPIWIASLILAASAWASSAVKLPVI